MTVILATNGPGELYAWVAPLVQVLRSSQPGWQLWVVLLPCQFATGNEARMAQTLPIDGVVATAAFWELLTSKGKSVGLTDAQGIVLSLGGNTRLALRLGGALGYGVYRYSYVPFWHRGLRKLFVHDDAALAKAARLGAPASRLELVGNLAADAVAQAETLPKAGNPHIYLNMGSRDRFSVFLIPFMLALADELGQRYPQASFVWPLSRLLSEKAVEDGISGLERHILDGLVSRREGNTVLTPAGVRVDIIPEEQRYAHMRAADLAVTIPGTNTLELGIAGVPAVVLVPMHKPENIPLEGAGHWLGLIPGIGKYLKRYAVRAFIEGLKQPTSLPNRLSGENLMLELTGTFSRAEVVSSLCKLLDDPAELSRRRTRLLETMPRPGAARRLLDHVLEDL